MKERPPPVESILDSARFYLQIVGGHCATGDYIRFEQRIHQIEQLSADTTTLASQRSKRAAALHRELADTVERHRLTNP